MLPCTRDGKPFLIKKLFYAQDIFDVFMAIHALSGTALHRLELWKLGFPETQHIGRQPAQLGDLSDAEIKLIRDHHIGGPVGVVRFIARAHRGFRSGLHQSLRLSLSAFLARRGASDNLSFSPEKHCSTYPRVWDQ